MSASEKNEDGRRNFTSISLSLPAAIDSISSDVDFSAVVRLSFNTLAATAALRGAPS